MRQSRDLAVEVVSTAARVLALPLIAGMLIYGFGEE